MNTVRLTVENYTMTTKEELKLDNVRKHYQEEGAAHLKGAIDAQWIKKLSEGTEKLLTASENKGGQEFSRPGEGRFFGDYFSWLKVEEYKDFIMNSNIGQIASEILQSDTIRFFYDQPLIKEPGTPKRTPWHHDYTYWPTNGEDVLSIWVPLDAATPENGVVTYVKGSHKWNAFFPPEEWSDNNTPSGDTPPDDLTRAGVSTGKQKRTITDIKRHPENYELLEWNVNPGDVLIHHSHTIHGAQGNLSVDKRRRAIAFRFFGERARWDDSRFHFMRIIKKMEPNFPYPELENGAHMEADIFPVIYRK